MKRLFSSILIFALIFTLLPQGTWAASAPDLRVTNNTTVRVEPGDRASISLELKNFGDEKASNIVATVFSDTTGNVFIRGEAVKTVSSIDVDKTGKVTFSIDVDSDASEGTYQIPYKVTYYGIVEEPTEGNDDEEDGEETDTTTGSAVSVKLTLEGVYNVRVSAAPVTVPDLFVSNARQIPMVVMPGEDFLLELQIENDGDGPARDIKATIGGLSVDTFSLRSALGTKQVGSINRGKKSTVAFELKAAKGLRTGSHPVTLNLSYKNDRGEIINSQSEEIYIQVGSNVDRAAKLVMQNISYPSGPIGQNKEVKVAFEIRNQGQSLAKNIVVNAESQDLSGLIPKSLSTAQIEALAPGAVANLEFTFITSPNASTMNYPVRLTIDYTDDYVSPEMRDTVSQLVGVFVSAPDDDGNLSTPKLIIEKYSFSPSMVEAGQNFEMFLTFFNTNSSRAVKNIKIFLTAQEETDSGSVFTPVNSSNTFYIDNIPPKGRVEKTLTMFTIPDAKAKTYTITANFEYEDTAANPYQAQEFIGIPVVQQSRLETGEVGYYPESYVGQSTPVSVEFYNTGKVTLYNMMIKIEGDFQTENGQYYVGNFNSGSSEYFEGYVIPNEPGELNGDIVFTFEDSTGQMQEIRKPFNLNVMDMMPMPDYPDDFPPFEEPSAGGLGSMKSLGIGAAVIAAAAIAFVVIRKRKKAKKALEDMEIDE